MINNFVNLIALDEVAGLAKDVATTPTGNYKGGCKVGMRARFVGIV